MKLLIIRHAQSSNNVLLSQGAESRRVEDPEVTARGRRQARRLGRHLRSLPPGDASWRPAMLYTSLMLRAADTASVLSRWTGAPLEAWEDLHEVGGIYLQDPATGERRGLPGAGRETLHARFPRLRVPETVRSDGWWNRPFEEEPEPPVNRAVRVARRLRELAVLPENASRTIGIVTHAGFACYLLPILLGMEGRARMEAVIGNTGCTLLDLGPVSVTLHFHNCLRHLPLKEIT